MKRIIILLLMSATSVALTAQDMRRMWISMPDSIIPYLTESNRTELADYVEMKMAAEVQNRLKDTTRITLLTNDFIDVELTASSRLQMKLLPQMGDVQTKVLCVVMTHKGPAEESTVSFYDNQWRPLSNDDSLSFCPIPSVDTYSFLKHSDSINEADYEEMLTMLKPLLVKMELSPTDDTLNMQLSLPLLSKEEESKIEPLLMQRKFKWTGERFN